jgi:hypothetical protein
MASEGDRFGWATRDRILHVLLFALAMVSGIQVGGALFDSLVNDPVWSASAAAARQWTQVDTSRFYIVFTNLLVLLVIITLVVGWRAQRPLRRWLRLATALFIIAIVTTFIYFLPELQQIRGAAAASIPDDELSSRIQRWTLLDTVREVLIFGGFALTLHTLGLSNQVRGLARDHGARP